MRQVLAMNPLASAMRYGPFLAGYWNSLVLLAHGAKHWGSELGRVTTLGGAAAANPAASSALRAAAQARYCIRTSFDRSSRPPASAGSISVFVLGMLARRRGVLAGGCIGSGRHRAVKKAAPLQRRERCHAVGRTCDNS